MQFHIPLNDEHIKVILQHLDSDPHGRVLRVIDHIAAHVNMQQQ